MKLRVPFTVGHPTYSPLWYVSAWLNSVCRRCRRSCMLADSEDWQKPVCYACYEAVAGNPHWHEVRA